MKCYYMMLEHLITSQRNSVPINSHSLSPAPGNLSLQFSDKKIKVFIGAFQRLREMKRVLFTGVRGWGREAVASSAAGMTVPAFLSPILVTKNISIGRLYTSVLINAKTPPHTHVHKYIHILLLSGTHTLMNSLTCKQYTHIPMHMRMHIGRGT